MTLAILVLRMLKQNSLYCRMRLKYIVNPEVQSETLQEANKQDAISCPSIDEKKEVGEWREEVRARAVFLWQGSHG